MIMEGYPKPPKASSHNKYKRYRKHTWKMTAMVLPDTWKMTIMVLADRTVLPLRKYIKLYSQEDPASKASGLCVINCIFEFFRYVHVPFSIQNLKSRSTLFRATNHKEKSQYRSLDEVTFS